MGISPKRIAGGAATVFAVVTNSYFIKALDWVGRVKDAGDVMEAVKPILDALAPGDVLGGLIAVIGLCLLFDFNPTRLFMRAKQSLPVGNPVQEAIELLGPNPLGKPDINVGGMPAPRQTGADFPEIGKAILDRYDGQAEAFPYRKAVLQISEVKATASQRAGEKRLSNIDCHMDIENHTRQKFEICRVRLVAINGEKIGGGSFLRIGRLRGPDTETEFAVRQLHSKVRINFMKRDLDDVVSDPPFLLCLNDRDLPLSDGKEYRFVFALECGYEHPTYATVRCFIPERAKIEITLENQSLDMPDEQA